MLAILTPHLVLADRSDNADLDDIKLYDIVKVEQCLDQAYDKIPGHARKLEFKLEGDDPFYEFDMLLAAPPRHQLSPPRHNFSVIFVDRFCHHAHTEPA